MVKSTCCFSRGPEFSSRHPQWVAHNCLSLPLREIQYSLLVSMATHPSIAHVLTHRDHTCIHRYNR